MYRGGNNGLDQATVRQEYTIGRPIQWAAFSSTSTELSATRRFVNPTEGVIFKLSVVSGRDIGPYSYFPSESEVLLSPNTTFAVTSDVYVADGYTFVDLTETQGSMLLS